MLNTLKFLVATMIGLWFLSSCGNDVPYLGPEPERPAIPLYPILSFQDSTDVLTTDAFVLPGATFLVRVQAEKGDSLLETLSISANNLEIDPSRITVNGNLVTSSNIPIVDPERNDFIWDIGIVAQADSSKVIYEFKLEDETGRTDFLDILINTRITAFAPPIIDFLGQSEEEVLTSDPVSFDITLDAIGSPIKSITVYQGADIVSEDRLKFDGMPFLSNPLELSSIDRDGFTKAIEISSDTVSGRQGYSVEFLDSLDNKFYVELALTAIRRVETFTDVRLEQGKAIELTTQEQFQIGFTKVIDKDEKSDIKDVSRIEGNWDQTIMATNQSNLKKINPGQGFVFEDVIGENVLKETWAMAVDFTDRIMLTDTVETFSVFTGNDTIIYRTTTYPISDKVKVNDLFIAKNDISQFIIKIKEVNAGGEYIFDLKY